MSDKPTNELRKTPGASRPLVPGPTADVCSRSRDLPWEYGLYLALHCPRCGQLSSLDPDQDKQSCLLEKKALHQLNLILDPEVGHQ